MKEANFEQNIESSKEKDNDSKIKEINQKVEKFYKKPENQEELQENIKTLKEIPEDKVEPKVVVKLGSPEKAYKFVYMKDGDNREYVIALPIEKKSHHKDIVEFSKKLYNKDLRVIGGGYIHTEDDKMIIDKSSGDYGFAPKEKVKEILKTKFPNVEIETRGKTKADKDKELKEKVAKDLKEAQGIYDGVMEFENEMDKDFYTDVLNNKALRLGMDYTSTPKSIEGEDNLSYFVYSSENGSSFGFDTLYIGLKDESGELVSKPILRERGYLHINNIKVKDDVLEVDYRVDGEDKKLNIPLDELEDFEMDELDLNKPEQKILEMYKDNQAIFKFAKVSHGVSM